VAASSDSPTQRASSSGAPPAPGKRPQRVNVATIGYRRIILLLIYLVLVPGVMMSTIGVILIVRGEQVMNLLLGILVLTFAGTLATGATLVWVFLRQARKLSELQADFVSKVSHELRTPLTSIRMFTETLALRRGDTAVEDRCITALGRESERLTKLIDRLLDWGRMESGRRVYDLHETSLVDVVHEAVAAFEPTREGRTVALELELEPDLPTTMADRAALVDALVNLLSNAYKYGGLDGKSATAEAPRAMRIRASRKGESLELAVSDDGLGIEKRHHKRIFEKFYRVDDLLSRKQEGSGLGLAIVGHVVRGHGGRVSVESELGKGSTFTIAIPITSPAKAARKAEAEPLDSW
jgi:two-component system phosphate regulon sensor histidine kinase PhoR